MDARVLQAQQWVNTTYRAVWGYVLAPEDGHTGWSTMYSLTRGLQHELGITALSDSLGPTTFATPSALGDITSGTSNQNIRTIVEAALYCKGYPGGDIDGAWGSSTLRGLGFMKDDMGFGVTSDGHLSPKQFKALLTMDAHVTLPGGSDDLRTMQQWMNATFVGRRDFYISPCHGLGSRGGQQASVLGVQYSLGMADGVANGVFGPNTQAGLRTTAAQLTVGRTDSGSKHVVKLFNTAMAFNGRSVDVASATFTATTSSAVKAFQTTPRAWRRSGPPATRRSAATSRAAPPRR